MEKCFRKTCHLGRRRKKWKLFSQQFYFHFLFAWLFGFFNLFPILDQFDYFLIFRVYDWSGSERKQFSFSLYTLLHSPTSTDEVKFLKQLFIFLHAFTRTEKTVNKFFSLFCDEILWRNLKLSDELRLKAIVIVSLLNL